MYTQTRASGKHSNAGGSKKGASPLTRVRVKRTALDFGFLISVILLLVLGLIMVFSASYPTAYYQYDNGFLVIKKQLIWAILGVGAMFFTANFDYRNYKRLAVPILVGCAVLLLAVLVVGIKVKGARRWL